MSTNVPSATRRVISISGLAHFQTMHPTNSSITQQTVLHRLPHHYFALRGNRNTMPISEEQLDAYSRFYKAHFDRVGREGSYEPPPSDISSSRSCTPTGLLTPSREDRGIARPTRIKLLQGPRPTRPAPLRYTQDPEFRQWLAVLPRLAPDFFPRLGSPDEYIDSNPGIEYDWDARTLRSKVSKQPYLFAMDKGGDAAIAFFGDDSPPASMSPEGTDFDRKCSGHSLTIRSLQ